MFYLLVLYPLLSYFAKPFLILLYYIAHGRFRVGKQEDAFEFYTCLLDHIHMQLSLRGGKQKKADNEGHSLMYSIFGTRVA